MLVHSKRSRKQDVRVPSIVRIRLTRIGPSAWIVTFAMPTTAIMDANAARRTAMAISAMVYLTIIFVFLAMETMMIVRIHTMAMVMVYLKVLLVGVPVAFAKCHFTLMTSTAFATFVGLSVVANACVSAGAMTKTIKFKCV